MAFFPLYFIMDSGYTNEVSVYKLYLLGANLSVIGRVLGQAFLRTTSPSRLRRATSPGRGGFGSPCKVNGFARGSPTRGAVCEADAGSRNPALSNEVRLRGCMKARLPSRCSRDGEAIPSPALLPSATGSRPSAQHNKQTKTPPTAFEPSAALCLFSQQRSIDQTLASLLCSAFL